MDISTHEICLCPDCECETRSECQMTCGSNNQCDCCIDPDEIPPISQYEDRL